MGCRMLSKVGSRVSGACLLPFAVVIVILGMVTTSCDEAWAIVEDVVPDAAGSALGVADETSFSAASGLLAVESGESGEAGGEQPGEAPAQGRPTLSPGWNKVAAGWKYGDTDGYACTGWLKWNGAWYWLNPEREGTMGVGWQFIGNTWYHLASSGSMQTGWLKLGRVWYYLSSSGAMATQWRKVGGAWYYFGDSGAMATGWRFVDGAWYHLASSGARDTGCLKSGIHWYYLGGNGVMRTGWYQVGNQWNYSNADGVWCESKWVKSGNRWWYKRADGTFPAAAWEKIGGKWYHFNADGWMQTGWLKDGDDWYWLDASGAMASDALVDGGRYYVGSDGKWQQATAKLFVLAGHGAGDPGALGSGYTEEWCTRYLAKKLKELGGDAVMLADLNMNPSKSGIISTMSLPLDTQLLEIHLDSAVASVRGGHVIIGSRQPTTYDKALAAAIGSLFPGRPQTIVHRTDLVDVARAAKRGYEYRLLEVCMITNKGDMKRFATNIDNVACAILRSFGIDPVK